MKVFLQAFDSGQEYIYNIERVENLIDKSLLRLANDVYIM